jgi:hypothetical protein
MALHKNVVAAYADGYASHAAGWMRGHGGELGGIEAYAAERGLAPSRLKETVTLMSRYAAAKKAGKIPARSFSLPLESAAHASHHLIQAGLDDFDVHTDEGSELTYFSFKANEDFSTAHEVVRQAFHRQIQSGEGEWANWKQLEPVISQHMAGSLKAFYHVALIEVRDSINSRGLNAAFSLNRSEENQAGEYAVHLFASLSDAKKYIKDIEGLLDKDQGLDIWKVWPQGEVEKDPTLGHSQWPAFRSKGPVKPEHLKLIVPNALPPETVKVSKKAEDNDDLPFQDIDDPVCFCGHTFSQHDRFCDICGDGDCSGYTPRPMEQQVEYVCERRAFGRVGKKSNPMVFERGKNDRILKVHFDGGRVSKAEFQENKGSRPEIRQGWEGFYSFTQAFGD